MDVMENRSLCLSPGWPYLPPEHFCFQAFEECLDGGVQATIFVELWSSVFPGDTGG